MPVNLSVKNVPDELAGLLRARARRHHRAIQRELLVILDEEPRPRPVPVEAVPPRRRARAPASPRRADLCSFVLRSTTLSHP